MEFEQWMQECSAIIQTVLSFDKETALQMILGAGMVQYRKKFDQGLTPQQCIDDETIYWNE